MNNKTTFVLAPYLSPDDATTILHDSCGPNIDHEPPCGGV